jgi:hypothetical protein
LPEQVGTDPSHLLTGLNRSFSDALSLLSSPLAGLSNCLLGVLVRLILLAWICHRNGLPRCLTANFGCLCDVLSTGAFLRKQTRSLESRSSVAELFGMLDAVHELRLQLPFTSELARWVRRADQAKTRPMEIINRVRA